MTEEERKVRLNPRRDMERRPVDRYLTEEIETKHGKAVRGILPPRMESEDPQGFLYGGFMNTFTFVLLLPKELSL